MGSGTESKKGMNVNDRSVKKVIIKEEAKFSFTIHIVAIMANMNEQEKERFSTPNLEHSSLNRPSRNETLAIQLLWGRKKF